MLWIGLVATYALHAILSLKVFIAKNSRIVSAVLAFATCRFVVENFYSENGQIPYVRAGARPNLQPPPVRFCPIMYGLLSDPVRYCTVHAPGTLRLVRCAWYVAYTMKYRYRVCCGYAAGMI